MRHFILILGLFLFTACSLKVETPEIDYYELYLVSNKCSSQNKSIKNLYIDTVAAGGVINSRDLVILSSDSPLVYLESFRFNTNPSDMLYKSLNKAFFINCNFTPSLMIDHTKEILRVRILDIGITDDSAIFSIAYEVLNSSVKSGVITYKTKVELNSNDGYFKALNLSYNKTIDELVERLKG